MCDIIKTTHARLYSKEERDYSYFVMSVILRARDNEREFSQDQFLNYLNMKPYTSILGVFYSLGYHILGNLRIFPSRGMPHLCVRALFSRECRDT